MTMIILTALLATAFWAFGGYVYLEQGSYDRHGGLSLLIILSYMILCALWAIACNIFTGWPSRD